MFDIQDDGVLNREQLSAALRLIADYALSSEAASGQSFTSSGAELSASASTADNYEPVEAGSGDEAGAGADDEDDENAESVVASIVDSLLDGDDEISYQKFIDMCSEEENVLSWLEKLAEGTGEFLEESMRAASERQVVELNLQRQNIIGQRAEIAGSYPLSPGKKTLASSPPFSFPSRNLSPRRPPHPSFPGVGTSAFSRSPSHPAAVDRLQKGSVPGAEVLVRQPFIVDYSQIKFGKVIGRGACATVWAGEWLHMPVAVKVFNEDGCSDAPHTARGGGGEDGGHTNVDVRLVGDLISEANVLKRVRHPNVCLFLCLCIEPKVCMVSELYRGGSVHDFLHGVKARRFGPRKALEMITNVARGMMYLHFSKTGPFILHRDLKTRNILLDRAVSHCVICDFGVSRLQDVSGTAPISNRGLVGTPHTMAPEVMEGREYTRAADVYSFAMVAYEMYTGIIPFKGLRAIQLMFMVTEGQRPVIDEGIFPRTLGKLIEKCWNADPEARPDFDTIMMDLIGENLEKEMTTMGTVIDGDDYIGVEDKQLTELKQNSSSQTLMDAVAVGNLEKTKDLLSSGADVKYSDYDSRTALHIACAEGHADVVKALLDVGASVQASDRWGNTPLADAERMGCQRIVEQLHAVGLKNPSLRNSASTRLLGERAVLVRRNMEVMLSIVAGNIELCRRLLESGYDVNGADYDDRTPCHLAVSEGHCDIVSLLIGSGCDLTRRDRWGQTILDEARRTGCGDIIWIVEKGLNEL